MAVSRKDTLYTFPTDELTRAAFASSVFYGIVNLRKLRPRDRVCPGLSVSIPLWSPRQFSHNEHRISPEPPPSHPLLHHGFVCTFSPLLIYSFPIENALSLPERCPLTALPLGDGRKTKQRNHPENYGEQFFWLASRQPQLRLSPSLFPLLPVTTGPGSSFPFRAVAKMLYRAPELCCSLSSPPPPPHPRPTQRRANSRSADSAVGTPRSERCGGGIWLLEIIRTASTRSALRHRDRRRREEERGGGGGPGGCWRRAVRGARGWHSTLCC